MINNTALTGKLKLWCFEFGLMPGLMWPPTSYEITLSHAKRLDRRDSAQVRKWLGLPRCLSSIGLYENGALSLLLSSLVEEYKCAKARNEMMLRESRDPTIRITATTGIKWKQWLFSDTETMWVIIRSSSCLYSNSSTSCFRGAKCTVVTHMQLCVCL